MDPRRLSVVSTEPRALTAEQKAATLAPSLPVCPTTDCVPHGAVQREVVQHHVGRPSDPRRVKNPVFLFCSQNRNTAAIVHMSSWRRPPPTPEKLHRYFTEVWLIGRSLSKHFRSDLITKQAAMQGISWGRWQLESTLKMPPDGISSL